jgi:hypothetical protein
MVTDLTKSKILIVVFLTTTLFLQSIVEGEQIIPAHSGQVQISQSQKGISIPQHRARILSSVVRHR